MLTVVLVIHLLLAIALVGLVLLQQSEGGALGIGGGMGGFMTGRATANLLTRATAILAACFMVTSLTLALMSSSAGHKPHSILDVPAATAPAAGQPAKSAKSANPAGPAQPAQPAKPAEPAAPLAK